MLFRSPLYYVVRFLNILEPEDDEDDYIESSDEDYETPKPKTPKPKTPKPKTPKPKTPRAKTPKKTLPKPVIQDEDDDIVEVYPSPSDSKNKFTYDDETSLTSPFDAGQKFSAAEICALDVKLAAVRKSIESVNIVVRYPGTFNSIK